MAAQKLFLTIVLLLGFLVLPKDIFASNLHLSPASGNVGVGQVVAVQIRINTAGRPINGVTAVLSYPADRLDVAYITPGSAFSIEAEKAIGGGTIKLSRGNINGVSGDVSVATIGFRGKILGEANIAFINGSAAPSAADSSETLDFNASRGSKINVVTPSLSSTPAPKEGPKISDLQVTDVATNSATVSWKTDRAADSTVEYGVDQNQFVLSTSSSDRVTDHLVKLENLDFPPGTKIYLRATSKDASGSEGVSGITSFSMKGYRVLVRMIEKDNKPLSNIKITLYSEPMENATNDQGQAVFEDVTPGNHALLVQNGTLEKSFDIEVADDRNFDTTQEFTFQFDAATSTTPRLPINFYSKNTWAMIILGLSLLTLIIIAVYIFRRRQGGGDSSGPSETDTNPFPFFDINKSPTQQNPVVYHPGQP